MVDRSGVNTGLHRVGGVLNGFRLGSGQLLLQRGQVASSKRLELLLQNELRSLIALLLGVPPVAEGSAEGKRAETGKVKLSRALMRVIGSEANTTAVEL